jgi:Zn-dependent protease
MNKLRWRLGDLLGHSVVVEITFLILAALFVFPAFGKTFDDHFAALLMAPILFVSILVHEMGHALAIDRFGYGKSTVLLWGMGGLCIGRGNRRAKHGLLISLAGPAAGLLIGIPALLLYLGFEFHFIDIEIGRTLTKALFFTVWVNVGWSILNLLPIFPLDGGQALMNILRMRGKSQSAATRTAGFIGLFVLAPLCLLAVFQLDIWMIFILFFIGRTTWTAYKTGRV